MAPDDRDRTFEKALARHLRSAASSGTDGNVPDGTAVERSIDPLVELCPDAEILAAYHDGSLSAEERNLWKQHVLGCDSCQIVLAHLATPLDIPVNLETSKNIEELKQPVSVGRAASPAQAARPSPLHSLRWLWLVPVGAIAAGLIALVSLKTPKPLSAVPSTAVEVAENRQSQSAVPSPNAARITPGEVRENERKEKDVANAPSAAGAASANRDLASNQLQNQTQLTQLPPVQSAGKSAHGPSLSMQKQEQQQTTRAPADAGALLKKKLDAQISSHARDQLEEVRRPQTPPPPSPAPPSLSAPSFVADGSVTPPPASKSDSVGGAAPAVPAPKPAPATASNVAAPKTDVANAETNLTITESVEVSTDRKSQLNGRAILRAAALQNPHVFWAPGERQAWRIGLAGSLEYSKDKGVNWTQQISGVYTDLLAGSAPSAKVCWIVGASGTILRTTDGGTHWSKLDSPVTNDLTGIRATDAMHAQIWFVPDPSTGLFKTYQTVDGGVTWSPAPTDH
jgi:hypothetical protein